VDIEHTFFSEDFGYTGRCWKRNQEAI